MITYIRHKLNKKADIPPYSAHYNSPYNSPYTQPHTSPYAQPHTSPYAQPHTSLYTQPHTSPYAPPPQQHHTLPRSKVYAAVRDEDDIQGEKEQLKSYIYEPQRALKKSFSNPNFMDYPDTKAIARVESEDEKVEFLREFSSNYGYNGKIDSIRMNEYPQLKGAVYLDHSGTTTYAKSLLTSVCNDLQQNLFGNPHSANPSSSLSSHRVMQTRLRILKHFGASPDEYEVIFTQNATGALKLVGESFPWVAGKSSFKYLRESHNSLLGIRTLAESAGLNDIAVIQESEVEDFLKQKNHYNDAYSEDDDDDDDVVYSLFAYPAQCNFSGQRFPLNWSSKLKRLDKPKSKHLVLLDAAAFAMTATLSLANKDESPDFVAISFYKMFGYPTGLGALLVKQELLPILRKRYFGGGTIKAVAYDRPWQRFQSSLSSRFEDGTINFLDIVALYHAFTAHDQIYTDFRLVKPHVTSLIIYLARRMRSFVHWNGIPACEVYTEREFTDNTRQGPVINFNIRRADGSWVGTAEVERMASANGIHIRVGGLCNPGCIAKWVDITVDDVMDTYAKYGVVCDNGVDYIKDKPAGGVRLSLGAMTTIDDVLAWIHFFKNYYVEEAPPMSHKKKPVHQQISPPVSKSHKLRPARSMQQLAPIPSTPRKAPNSVASSNSDASEQMPRSTSKLKMNKNRSDRVYLSPELTRKRSLLYSVNKAYM